jgi:SagB-type dehydrogenase family enzyme
MAKTDNTNNSDSFDSFWEKSTYSRFNIKEFAAVQEQYSASDKVESILEYPSAPTKLALPKTKTNYLAKRRKSERTFSGKSLTRREFGALLSSFYAYNGPEHRSYPSAGGSYAVEVFCIANNVTGFSGKVLYYNPDIHAVSIIDNAPSWDKLSDNINVLTSDTPQCILVFVLFPDRLTAKYLERGGRFGLIEVGAAMQQLANQIAGSKTLKGVAAGGMIDDYWLKVLGLNKTEAKIALGYLCGK